MDQILGNKKQKRKSLGSKARQRAQIWHQINK